MPSRFSSRLGFACLALAPSLLFAAPRLPWTASRIVGTPEAPAPYVAETAFPGLVFDTPVELVAGPDGSRLYVIELSGRIQSFTTPAAGAHPEEFANLAAVFPDAPALHVYGLAFHPQFATNREVYIRVRLTEDTPDGSRVLRGKVPAGPVPRLDPASVETILIFRSGSHCGGNLLFGADGYLYITTGDAGPATPPDIFNTGQTLTDLEAAILRIDVDGRDPGLAYRIPPDNPFVDMPGARGEIWAYGLRNPWKIAFRPGTSDLWAGDVGWERWEMIHRIERGGNYGWPITEGPQPVKPDHPRGPTPILPPVVVHPHTEAASITGGVFYTGSRLPELRGAYLYGDFMTGRIWALWHDGVHVTDRRELARTPFRLVTFGTDSDGEVYFTDFGENQPILHLTRRPVTEARAEPFPRKLSETGLFADTASERPQPGVVPYTINAPLWQDGATATRWLAMPAAEPAGLLAEQRGPVKILRATVADGTVFVRTIALELIRDDPASRRRVETQLLHFDGREWHGYTYRWNDEQTDADLVEAAGDSTTWTVTDDSAPGGQRSLPWRFHSRSECLQCHNDDAGRALGFVPGNLDVHRLHAEGVVTEDYLPAAIRAALVDPADPHAPLDLRARSWLHANCAHCHRFQGGGSGIFLVNIEVPPEKTHLATKPLQGDFGLPDARVAAPGAPERSTLFYRIAKAGPGHMPQLGATTPDPTGMRVLWDWIAGAPFAPRSHASVTSPSEALHAVQAIDRGALAGDARERLVTEGLASGNELVRALFQRYLPDSERVATLGHAVDPYALLALRGAPDRGRDVATRAACLTCHRVGEEGREFGPDLSAIGLRLSPLQLVESLVEPSKFIAPEYVAHVFELNDGTAHTGFVVSRTPDAIRVRTPSAEIVSFTPGQVRSEAALPVSLMPPGLLAGLTAQEAADLIAYLAALGK